MIRKTKPEDIPEVMNIICDAQAGMKLLGISQWQNGYPNEASFAKDIAEGISHVYVENGEIVAMTLSFAAPEPDYAKIYEGEWKTKGNIPMRSFLKKQGFEECGIIYLSNEGCVDNKRVAYEKVIAKIM